MQLRMVDTTGHPHRSAITAIWAINWSLFLSSPSPMRHSESTSAIPLHMSGANDNNLMYNGHCVMDLSPRALRMPVASLRGNRMLRFTMSLSLPYHPLDTMLHSDTGSVHRGAIR